MPQSQRHVRGNGLFQITSSVHATAFIAPTATVGARSFIGVGSYIDSGVTVGDDVIICEQVKVGANSTIGNGSILHSNVVLPPGSNIAPGTVLDYNPGGTLSLGLMGKWLVDGHALSGLNPQKTEFLFDPFFQLPVNGNRWTETLTGTGATATQGTGIDGGAVNLVTGAAGTYKILPNIVTNLIQFFTAWNSRWFAAFQVKASAVPAAGQNASFGYTNSVDGLRVGIGWDGTFSTTKYCLLLNDAGQTLSSIPIDTNFHTFYLWCAGTTIFGSVDGEAPISMAAIVSSAQSKALCKAVNLAAIIDAGLWLAPSTVP